MDKSTLTILLIEDELELRENLRDVLADDGYQVVVAAHGREAMLILEQMRPSLIIMDLILPLVSGNEIYDLLQQRPPLKSIPVLVTTSDPSRAPPGVPTLPKPVDLDELLRMVELACSPD